MECDLTEAMDCSSKMNLVGIFQENSENSVQSPSETRTRNIIESFGQFVHKFSSNSSKKISAKSNINFSEVSPEMITKSLKEAFPRKTVRLFQKHAVDHCPFSVSKKISPKVKTIQKSLQRVSFAKFHRQPRENFARTPGKGPLKIDCSGADSSIGNETSSSTFTPTITLDKINKNRNEYFKIRSSESCTISNTNAAHELCDESFRSNIPESFQFKRTESMQRKSKDSFIMVSTDHFSRNSNLFSRNTSDTFSGTFSDSSSNLNEQVSRNLSENSVIKSNDSFATNSNSPFTAYTNVLITSLIDESHSGIISDSHLENSNNLVPSNSKDSFQNCVVDSFQCNLNDPFQANANSLSKIDEVFSGTNFNSFPRINRVTSDIFPRIENEYFPRIENEYFPRIGNESFFSNEQDSFFSNGQESFPRIGQETFPRIGQEFFTGIGQKSFLEIGNECFAKKSFENSSDILPRESMPSTQNMFSGNNMFTKESSDGNTRFSNTCVPSEEISRIQKIKIPQKVMKSNRSSETLFCNNAEMLSETTPSKHDNEFQLDKIQINCDAEFCKDKTANFFRTNTFVKPLETSMGHFSEKLAEMKPNQQCIVLLKDTKILEDTRKSFDKAIMPMVSSNSLLVDDSSLMDNLDCGLPYDPNRRSSLGAESLLEHDISEEGNAYDNEGMENLLYAEAQLGLEYADDIFNLYRNREKEFHPYNCMDDQPQVTEFMRCTLVHWLTKVNHQLKFQPETIFIAVSLTDRFLSSTPIAQDCLQLLAVCALFVAAKLEESSVPGISALVSLCGKTYKHHHFRRMEKLLLSTLSFELHAPTSWFFVTHLMLKTCQLTFLDRRMLSLARDAVETCLGSYAISQFLPSEQAAAAICYSYLVLYAPATIHEISLLTSSCKESEAELQSDDATDERWKLHKILSLNSAGSSLMWVFFNVFTNEEIGNINKCLGILTPYMEPFIQSLTFETESTYISDVFKSKKTDTATLSESLFQQQKQSCSSSAKFTDNLKLIWKETYRKSTTASCSMKGCRDKIVEMKGMQASFSSHEIRDASQTGSAFCFGQSDCSMATVSRCSRCCEFCLGDQQVSQIHVCKANYICCNSGSNCCRAFNRSMVSSDLSVLSTPASCNEVKDKRLYKEGDIYTSDFVEVNNEQYCAEQGKDDRNLVNIKSKDVDSKSKFKSLFSH